MSIFCRIFKEFKSYFDSFFVTNGGGGVINYHLSIRWLSLDPGDERLDPDEVENEMRDEGHHQVLVHR